MKPASSGNGVLARRLPWLHTLLSSALLLVAGCTVGTPWPRIDATPIDDEERPVVLVLTHVRLEPGNRKPFDQANRRVLASMKGQPGLLGFAARRQVFGHEGWTMSIWTDEASVSRFVSSSVNWEAIRQAEPSLIAVTTRRLTMRRPELPANWAEALALLEGAGARDY